MGAHTFGAMDRDNSGYVGPWLTNRTVHFSNQFYQLMLSTEVTWENRVSNFNLLIRHNQLTS